MKGKMICLSENNVSESQANCRIFKASPNDFTTDPEVFK